MIVLIMDIRDYALSTLFDMNGNVVANTLNFTSEYNKVKERMIIYCNEQNRPDLIDLCAAFSKYDFHGAPSNWEYNDHEKTVYDWVVFCVSDIEYKKDLKVILKDFKEGRIPDCYDLMIDYFC